MSEEKKPVEIVWHEERDDRRLRRVGELLANILDNETKPPTLKSDDKER